MRVNFNYGGILGDNITPMSAYKIALGGMRDGGF